MSSRVETRQRRATHVAKSRGAAHVAYGRRAAPAADATSSGRRAMASRAGGVVSRQERRVATLLRVLVLGCLAFAALVWRRLLQ